MRTVVFLGKRTGPGSPKAQWPGCTLWGTTHSNQKWRKYGTVDDWDAWWDLHPFNPVPGYAGIKQRRLKTYRWYQTLPGPDQPGYRPLWLVEPDPTIPAGVLFPKAEILAAFDRQLHGRWFTCQVDLMMAYAIHCGRIRSHRAARARDEVRTHAHARSLRGDCLDRDCARTRDHRSRS